MVLNSEVRIRDSSPALVICKSPLVTNPLEILESDVASQSKMKISLAISAFMPLLAMAIPLTFRGQHPKTAGEAFKNVQVLKRAPADNWFDTMAFIAGSLGVTCDHCHSSKFETDEGNPKKEKAREMMRMVDRINADQFGGHNVVTCFTCHRGSVKPQGNQIPDAENWMRAAEGPSPHPTAQAILIRYRGTLGGVKSQSISLRVQTYGGKGPAKEKTAHVLLNGGNARISERIGRETRTMVRSNNKTWIDEGKGWRTMNEGETFDAFEVAEVLSPDQVGAVEAAGAVFTDRVNGHHAYVVPVTGKDGRKWLFFDPDTGVLLRQRQLSPSFYGDATVDVNYDNFRNYGRARLPATVEVVNAGGAGLIVRHVLSRRVNVPLAQSSFEPATD